MVDYGQDWVQVNYAADHTFEITATDGVDDYTVVKDTKSGEGWWAEAGLRTDPSDWAPEQPDMNPGTQVEVQSDDGYSNLIEVGTITGTIDLETNSISGRFYAPFGGNLTVYCHPWT
jgi:hypothetical protein